MDRSTEEATELSSPQVGWDPSTPSDELEAPVVDETPSVDSPTTHYPAARPPATRATPPPAAAPGDAYLAPGTMLGDYRVEQPLGEGGMGVVYAAIHPLIGKRAAVKVLRAELCRSAFNVERFVDEARIVNQIGHPNIVDVFAFGQTPDGRSYFVMEWLKGESLRARVARSRLDLDEICDVIRPLARALEAAHEQGVIHRDLKPDNVFLVEVRGQAPLVKLLDFGIAKLSREEHRMERTATGAMVGTPQYIAPEQAKGHAIDHRVDIYSLGGIVFELLTGRPPFVADNAMEVVAKHLMEPPPRPASLADVPPELDDLVVRMLAKDAAARPTLAEVATVIERTSALDRTSVKTPIPPTRQPLDTSELAAPPTADAGAGSQPVAAPGAGPAPTAPAAAVAARTASSGVAPYASAPALQSPPRRRGFALLLGGGFVIAAGIAFAVVSRLGGDERPDGASGEVASTGAPGVAGGGATNEDHGGNGVGAEANGVGNGASGAGASNGASTSGANGGASASGGASTGAASGGASTSGAHGGASTGASGGASAGASGGASAGASGGASSGASTSGTSGGASTGGASGGASNAGAGGTSAGASGDRPTRGGDAKRSPRHGAAKAKTPGRLELTITGGTGSPRVLVDGVEGGSSRELAPGLHTVEVSAPGAKPVRFRIKIEAGRTSPKRVKLEPTLADDLLAPGATERKPR